MKKFNKVIKIEIQADQVANMLLSKMDQKFAHSENVVESIIGTMDNHGLSMLYNAINGFSPEIDFKVGDEVQLKRFETYGYWTKESIEQRISVRGAVTSGVIKNIDLYAMNKLEIEYTIPKIDGKYNVESKWMNHLDCNQLAFVESEAIAVCV